MTYLWPTISGASATTTQKVRVTQEDGGLSHLKVYSFIFVLYAWDLG